MWLNKLRTYSFRWLAAFFLAVVLTWPGAWRLSTHLIGAEGDNLQFYSWGGIITQSLQQGAWPLGHSDRWRYPTGFAFGQSLDAYLFLFLNTLVSALITQPIVRYNLVVLALLATHISLCYPLFKKLSGSRLGGALGSIAYGASFQALARINGHINLMGTAGFAVVAYGLLEWWQNQNRHRWWTVGLGTLLIGVSSLQYLLILVGSLPWLGLGLGLTYPQLLWDRCKKLFWQLPALAVVGIVLGTPFVALIWQTLWAMISGSFVSGHNGVEELQHWAPSLWNIVVPNGFLNLWYDRFLPDLGRTGIDFSLHIGLVETVLFVGFIFTSLRKKYGLLTLAITTWFGILMLGVKSYDFGWSLPYTHLVNWFPYWGVAESTRWYVLFYLGIVSGGVWWLGQWVHRSWFTKSLAVVLIMIIILERLSVPFATTSMAFLHTPYIATLTNLKPKAILDLPVDMTWGPLGNKYDALSTVYPAPIVNGYVHWSVETSAVKQFITTAQLYWLMCNNDNQRYFAKLGLANQAPTDYASTLLANLQQAGIDTIVLHKYPDSQLYYEKCYRTLGTISQLLPRVTYLEPTKYKTEIKPRHYAQASLDESLALPYTGTLKIHAFKYTTETVPAELTLTLNNSPLVGAWKYTQEILVDSGTTLITAIPFNADETLELPIQAGSIIKINAPTQHTLQGGFVRLVMDYKADTNQGKVLPDLGGELEKVYDDDQHEVFSIRPTQP